MPNNKVVFKTAKNAPPNLFNQPKNTKASSPETILLHEGTKVYILESIANWKKVQLTDETTGWISDEAIKELN
jgi:SH3-like domain-containing protein